MDSNTIKKTEFEGFKKIVPPPICGKKLNYLVVMMNVHANTFQFQGAYFYQGTAYISSALKASGRNVFTLNLLEFSGKSVFEIINQTVSENDIDVFLLGGTTSLYTKIKEAIDIVKKIKPGIVTIVGGGLISSVPKIAMEALECADYGVIGEGEITVCELAYAIEKSSLENTDIFSDVKGIIYNRDGEWKETERREEILDLDIIPWPDYEGFDFEHYLYEFRAIIKNKPVRSKHGAAIIFGRSCPFNCTFCFHPTGSTYRQRSLDSFFAELSYLIDNYQITYLMINDELLFSNKKLAKEFCERIKEYDILWSCSLRVDIVTRELISMMSDSGCVFFAFGLESADDSILKSMRKHITVSQIENALDICFELGVNGQGNFIFGDLNETYETAMNTINFVKAHPQYSNIALDHIITFPGSHLFNVAVQKGIIKDPVQFIKEGCPVINISKMTHEERQAIEGQLLLMNSLQMRHAKIQDAILYKGKQEGSIDVEGCCEYCGKRGTWHNLDAFRPATDMECTHCGALLVIYASDFVRSEVIENNIQSLNANKIALWPIVNGCGKIFEIAPSLKGDNVFLVDSSKSKWDVPILNKKILPSSVINEEHIDTVIITINTDKIQEIKRTIAQDFPDVKNVICISNLLL